MKFEVVGKREERTGMIIKKPVYLAECLIHLTDEEFDALKDMAPTKQWKMYPLGEITIGDRHRTEVSMEMFYSWAKKTKVFSYKIRTALPEERELQISEVMELASTAKQVLQARISALNTSDEDMAIEI